MMIYFLKKFKTKLLFQLKKWVMYFCGSLLPCSAFAVAGDISSITDGLGALEDIVLGSAATIIAVLAVATVGFLWLVTKKINIQTAGICCLGIGVLFGAPDIVTALGGGSI
jgi:type IV secretory pathway VirB2 component (pilin)